MSNEVESIAISNWDDTSPIQVSVVPLLSDPTKNWLVVVNPDWTPIGMANRVYSWLVTAPTFTDNWDWTATLGSCEVNLFSTNDFNSQIRKYTVAWTTLTFTAWAEEYVCVSYNSGSPILYKETNKANTNVFTYTSWTLNQIAHDSWITPPWWASLSDIIQIRVIRDTTNASWVFAWADLYTWSVSVTAVDIHYEQDTLWSNQEYVK